MRIIALILLAVVVPLGTISCAGGQVEPPAPSTVYESTPDLPATVEARVQGTREVEDGH